MNRQDKFTVIEGGRCYEHDGDTDAPATRDILIRNDAIVAIDASLGERIRAGDKNDLMGDASIDTWLDARNHLVMPGFVSAHYHSHDTLLRGSFETVPLDYWLMVATPPGYPPRTLEELRARTLVGAIECLRAGITTVQDLASVYPYSDEAIETILNAYAEVGIRCNFALQVVDKATLDVLPFWKECIPSALHASVTGTAKPQSGLDLPRHIEEVYRAFCDFHPRITWSLGPSSPSLCTRDLLEALVDLSRRETLPMFTHIYEKKGMALNARTDYEAYGGSLVRFLNEVGASGPLVSLAHSIWLSDAEIEELAANGTNVILCPASNLKTRAGIPPLDRFFAHGVSIALGTDNCSCGDSQNMFSIMKLVVTLAAICTPVPGAPWAKDVIEAATLGGARALGLSGKVGALKSGMKADLFTIDLTDPSYMPLNSIARQVVYADSGRAVRTVMVDGELVVEDGQVTTIDESALHEQLQELMPGLRADREAVIAKADEIYPFIKEADRRVWDADVGFSRFVGGQ